MFKSAFGVLQQIGKALMLPVAVLPVAGLLLGIGASNSPSCRRSCRRLWPRVAMPSSVTCRSSSPSAAAWLGQEHGVAAIAAVVGYFVMTATLSVMAVFLHVLFSPARRCRQLLPACSAASSSARSQPRCSTAISGSSCRPISAFRRGKRLQAIVTGLAAIVAGVVLSFVWQPVPVRHRHLLALGGRQRPAPCRDRLRFRRASVDPVRPASHLERAVLLRDRFLHRRRRQGCSWRHQPLLRGRSHSRYPKSGAFLFKMGSSRPPRSPSPTPPSRRTRLKVGGHDDLRRPDLVPDRHHRADRVLLPVRRSRPYAVHAVLAATTQFVANTLDIHMGFTFRRAASTSSFNVFGSNAHNWWMTLILGPIYAAIYYGVFRFAILKFDLKHLLAVKTMALPPLKRQMRRSTAAIALPPPASW